MESRPFIPSRFAGHKFVILIGGTLVVASTLVGIALWLYTSSGTELLDVSRPGYQSISKKITSDQDKSNGFASSGSLDRSAMTEFQAMYRKTSNKVTGVNPFGGDPLSPDILGLGESATTAQ